MLHQVDRSEFGHRWAADVLLATFMSINKPAPGWVRLAGDPQAPEWQHVETSDRWQGGLAHGLPSGDGKYVFANSKLQVSGSVHGNAEHLVFSGPGVMKWPDGARFDGELRNSKFDGLGKFTWANHDFYEGAWRDGQRHGTGSLVSRQTSLVGVSAVEIGKCAHEMRYCGEWENDLMDGKGVIEYFEAPVNFGRQLPDCAVTQSPFQDGDGTPSHGEFLRRFEGLFKKGFPTSGSLQTRTEACTEHFAHVHFDGATHAGDFATWYWTGSATGEDRGTSLVDLACMGEEYRAASSRFSTSMKGLPGLQIASIQRVQNDDRRVIYDMQRRALEKKVTAPPRSRAWNTRTMERWAFHAPGHGAAQNWTDRFGNRLPPSFGPTHGHAAPWESIVEEGFQATLAGSDNGKVFGAGVYFATDAALAHKYALNSASRGRSSLSAGSGTGSEHDNMARTTPLRVFLSRIVTGVYTVGNPGMNIPPLDPSGAKGEHFHSLVDSTTYPRICVINDNTRAYPAYLITYSDSSAHAVPSIMAQALQAPLFTARAPGQLTASSMLVPNTRLGSAVRSAHKAQKTATKDGPEKTVECKKMMMAAPAVKKSNLLKGTCKFGDKCTKSHATPQGSVLMYVEAKAAEDGGSVEGNGGGSKMRKKGKGSKVMDQGRGDRQNEAASTRKPLARFYYQKSSEAPAPQQDIGKEGLQTGGIIICDTEPDAPANTRNRRKRVCMLDDSDDDHPPPSAEEASGRTMKVPKMSQPGDRLSDDVIVISDSES